MNTILPDKFNTCIVIVTFNPDTDFVHNLLQHIQIVEKILIIDNNSDVNLEYIIPTQYLSKIDIIHSEKNNGIASALNIGIKKAIKLNYNWVLTFDQDSFPNINILKYYASVLEKERGIGLLGTKFSPNVEEIFKISWKDSLTLITSGALHPVEIFEKVNFYNESLFIDSVDFDFALRVKLGKYRVVRIEEPLLSHKLGTPIKKFGIVSSNHNLIRRYYYSRNHLFLTKTYFGSFPFWILKKNLFFIKSILVLIIVEDNVLDKLRIIYKGVKDGYKGF